MRRAGRLVCVTGRSNRRCYSQSSTFVSSRDKPVSFVGMPYSFGQPKGGVEKAPQAMFKRNIIKYVKEIDQDREITREVNYQDVNPPSSGKYVSGLDTDNHPKAKNSLKVGLINKEISDVVHSESNKNNFVVNLGGDHSLAVGTITGLLRTYPNLQVVWVDAHADINTPVSSPSGNIHGMPVSILMQLQESLNIPGFEWIQSQNITLLKSERLVYIGLRDVDINEKKILKQHNFKAFDMKKVDQLGIVNVIQSTIQHLKNNNKSGSPTPIHLSFDIDALDPIYCSATGTAVNGGLTLREGRLICESLAELRKETDGLELVSMDMMEVNPDLSDAKGQEVTLDSAFVLIRAALGASFL